VIVWLVFEMDEHNNRNDLSAVFASKQAAEQWIAARKNPLPFFIEDWLVLGEEHDRVAAMCP
jgi:hypothetical protein